MATQIVAFMWTSPKGTKGIRSFPSSTVGVQSCAKTYSGRCLDSPFTSMPPPALTCWMWWHSSRLNFHRGQEHPYTPASDRLTIQGLSPDPLTVHFLTHFPMVMAFAPFWSSVSP